MKRFFSLCAVLVMAATTVSAAEVVWLENFEQAKKNAGETGRPIFALFTGSDWRPWCVRLNDEILAQPAFKKFAAARLVLFKADFPRAKTQEEAVKRQNNDLSGQYGIRGFPTVLLMKADGTVVGKTGYQRGGDKEYVKMLKDLRGSPARLTRAGCRPPRPPSRKASSSRTRGLPAMRWRGR